MPVVEVPCPNCGAKLKAPENMAGKKARCNKCGTKFRIPGPASDSVGDEAEVAMAEPVAERPLPPPPTPVPAPAAALKSPKEISSLPSADPFDFGKSAKLTPPPAPAGLGGSRKDGPTPTPVPAAKPTKAGSSPNVPPITPGAKSPPAPAKPTTKARSEPEPLTLDEEPLPIEDLPPDDLPPAVKAKSTPPVATPSAPAGPSSPVTDEKSAKSKGHEDSGDDRSRKKRKGDKDGRADGAQKPPAAPAEPAPGADPSNPFAFTALTSAPAEERPTGSKRRKDEEDEDDRPRKKRKGDEELAGEDKPRYRGAGNQGGMGKAIFIAGGVGLLALVLGVAAVIVYVKNNKKEPEQTKEEKKEAPPGSPDQPPKEKEVKAKSKDKDPDPKMVKDPEPPPAPGARPFVRVDKLKTFAVSAPPAKPTLTEPRKNQPTALDVPPANVRRVFPPQNITTGDTCVLIQTAAAAGGKGEKLALESYGPVGNRIPTARIEYEGDGLAVPIADLRTSAAGNHFLAAVGGKLHVWSVNDKTKIADGISPYADKPEHAKAGLAAAFFAPDPNQVVTVSTAGAVLLYDLGTRKSLAEFIPPDGVPGKVALGQSVAKADGNGSVAVAVAGVLYQVQVKDGLEVVRKFDLGGEVGRSIALAVGGTPGRLLYVFETAPDRSGKKDTAVLGLPLGEEPKSILYQLPAAAVGEPKGALWVSGDLGGVITDRGVVWFDDQEGKFLPLVFTQPVSSGLYFGDEKYLWYVIPNTTMATRSVVGAVTGDFNDRTDFQKNYPNQPLRTLRIDSTGLLK